MYVFLFTLFLFFFSFTAMTMDFDDMSFDEVKALYKGKERLIDDVLSPVDAANISRYESELRHIEARINLMKERDEEKFSLEIELNEVQRIIKYIYIKGLNELSIREQIEEEKKKIIQSRAEEKIKRQKNLADLVKTQW